VTVRLDPSAPSHRIGRVQVSAHLRPPNPADSNDPVQSRFSALRQFEILACEATSSVDCADDADFSVVFTSPADAFPAIVPRPRAPNLIMRSFDIPRTRATHIRLRVLTNPVHRHARLPGRAGQRPAGEHRLHHRQRAGAERPRRRAAGIWEVIVTPGR
jgi:hypothetical protein